MNNYCKYLKKRKNKPYCNIIRKEISLSRCLECGNKEYKKSTISSNSSAKRIEKNNRKFSNSAKSLHKMKNKSKKLAKLERGRFSVFTDDLTTCYLCGKPKNDLHELLEGRNRINSIKYGYVIPVCRLCHSQIQNNAEFKNVWAKNVQEHFEDNIGSRDEFLKVFRKNYLE